MEDFNEEQSDMNHVCIESDCGKEFQISKGEAKYFEDRGFFLPKRCMACRRKRKQAKETY